MDCVRYQREYREVKEGLSLKNEFAVPEEMPARCHREQGTVVSGAEVGVLS